jgi:hypothetical protein
MPECKSYPQEPDTFYVKKIKLNNTLFNNKIEVFIGGTVLDIPEIEYLVPFNKFVEYLKKNNFELLESHLFVPPKSLPKQEYLLSSLYRTFVFKYTG